MKKLLGILVLSLLICNSNFVDAKSSELINTIMKKNENFNLGIDEFPVQFWVWGYQSRKMLFN